MRYAQPFPPSQYQALGFALRTHAAPTHRAENDRPGRGVREGWGGHCWQAFKKSQVAAPAREELAQLHSVPTVAPLGTPH